MKRYFFCVFLAVAFFVPLAARAEDRPVSFFVESSYDVSGRSTIQARLLYGGPTLTFYIDDTWWTAQTPARQSDALNEAYALSDAFERKIYPTLTSTFGSEWKPGVDGDSHTFVLVHPMIPGAGGYFRNADEYVRLQSPESNEHEMVYLALSSLDSSRAPAFLAHEFTHLIAFNQKDRLRGVLEETWLNEARADYAPTLLGYDTPYEGSILENRVRTFLSKPGDALLEWQGKKEDYGVLSLFTHYLVDHYGITILADSLKSDKVGIASINEALAKYGSHETFADIFTNWTIAAILNDCSYGAEYCYTDPNLSKIRLTPAINFLPLSGQSTLSTTNVTKDWSGHWEKFVGGQGVLKINFSGVKGLRYNVPYLTQGQDDTYQIANLQLSKDNTGEVFIPRFGSETRAVVLIPSLQSHDRDVDGEATSYPFSFSVSIVERTPEEERQLISDLLAQIASLKKQIELAKLKLARAPYEQRISCDEGFTRDLVFGMREDRDVECLQTLLRDQGSDMYPEGFVTGNFGLMTRQAVIRFQEQYRREILDPARLTRGTGFVGSLTRAKLNVLLALDKKI